MKKSKSKNTLKPPVVENYLKHRQAMNMFKPLRQQPMLNRRNISNKSPFQRVQNIFDKA